MAPDDVGEFCMTPDCMNTTVPGESHCEQCKLHPELATLENTLKARGELYGGFQSESEAVMSCLVMLTPVDTLAQPVIKHALHMIVTKLARARVCPTHVDNWRDIAGYATLVQKHLESK